MPDSLAFLLRAVRGLGLLVALCLGGLAHADWPTRPVTILQQQWSQA